MPLKRVEKIINEWPIWLICGSKPSFIKPLLGGTTNRSYLLEEKNRLLVLRLFCDNSDHLDIDRHTEKQAMRLAANKLLAPRMLYLDPGLAYSISEYIPGQTLGNATPQQLQSVAQLLKNLHSIDIQYQSLPKLVISAKAERYWQTIAELGQHPQLLKYKEPLQAYFKSRENQPQRQTLCHNDPIADNFIISDQRLQLIDWEYAAIGNPLFDLAIFILNQQLNADQEQQLLDFYHDQPIDPTELHNSKLDVLYLEWLWWLIQNNYQHNADLYQRINTIQHQLLALLSVHQD